MSSKKLTKKAFEQLLNEKGDKYYHLDIDLTGMDDYFEMWKTLYTEAMDRGSEGTVFPGYGTWLRVSSKDYSCTHISSRGFDSRYHHRLAL